MSGARRATGGGVVGVPRTTQPPALPLPAQGFGKHLSEFTGFSPRREEKWWAALRGLPVSPASREGGGRTLIYDQKGKRKAE